MEEQLKVIKTSLLSAIQSQMGNLEQVDAKELGEAMDIVKDCCEACMLDKQAKYYEKIVESMEEAKKEDELLSKVDRVDSTRYYSDGMYRGGRRGSVYMRGGRRGYGKDYYPEVYDPNNEYYMNRGRMYYDGNGMGNSGMNGNGSMGSGTNGTRNYGNEYYSPSTYTESRYDMGRRRYTDSKLMHTGNTQEDKNANMASLEEYLKGLSEDVTELVGKMDATEKATMKDRIQKLAAKIV